MSISSINRAARNFLADETGLGATDYVVLAALILIIYPHVVYPGVLRDLWHALVSLFS